MRYTEEWLQQRLNNSKPKPPPPSPVPAIKDHYDIRAAATDILVLATIAKVPADDCLIKGLNVELKSLSRPDQRREYERIEQILTLIWLRLESPEAFEMITAIPMGGYRPNGSGGQVKSEGAKKGYPDLILDIPAHGYHGLRIEMKRYDRSSKPSPEQVDRLTRLASYDYRAFVCHGHQSAIYVLAQYLSIASNYLKSKPEDWSITDYNN